MDYVVVPDENNVCMDLIMCQGVCMWVITTQDITTYRYLLLIVGLVV